MAHQAEHQLNARLASPCQDPLAEYLEFLIQVRAAGPPALYRFHLERCLQQLSETPRYKNDPRYIDLWLQAASCPATFKFMAQNGIGLQSPAFYAAYSRVLASAGLIAQALKVHATGEEQCLNLVYSAQDLHKMATGPDPDPLGAPLPPMPPARPASEERLSIDPSLLFDDTGEITFVELIMATKGISLSPSPRRHDPLRPPEVPAFDFDQPGQWAPQAVEKTQTIKRRYRQSPSAASSLTASSGTASSLSSIAYQHQPNKILQVLEFDKQPPVRLQLSPHPPITLPAVVDPSLATTRQAFIPLIPEILYPMGPSFVQNQVTRNGTSLLTKQNLPENLELTNISLRVRKIIGTGGYGTVFSAVNPVTNARYALKLEKGNIPWEWYVVSMARSRLQEERALHSIINCFCYEGYLDEQYMLMPLIGYDSLLAVANYVRSRQLSTIDTEFIAAYFSIELLRTITALHKNRIIHGDLKAENVMLRAPPDKSIHSGYLGRLYNADGADKWNEYGILLIDFGRAIDLEIFPPGQQFEATWTIDEDQDCWEMRKKLPWTYQPDYFGIASIAHLILFGKYLKIKDMGQQKTIVEPFKRSMNADMWSKFFTTLLNPSSLPLLGDMAALQRMLELWLHSEGEGKIHHLLTDIAYDIRKKRLI